MISGFGQSSHNQHRQNGRLSNVLEQGLVGRRVDHGQVVRDERDDPQRRRFRGATRSRAVQDDHQGHEAQHDHQRVRLII